MAIQLYCSVCGRNAGNETSYSHGMIWRCQHGLGEGYLAYADEVKIGDLWRALTLMRKTST